MAGLDYTKNPEVDSDTETTPQMSPNQARAHQQLSLFGADEAPVTEQEAKERATAPTLGQVLSDSGLADARVRVQEVPTANGGKQLVIQPLDVDVPMPFTLNFSKMNQGDGRDVDPNTEAAIRDNTVPTLNHRGQKAASRVQSQLDSQSSTALANQAQGQSEDYEKAVQSIRRRFEMTSDDQAQALADQYQLDSGQAWILDYQKNPADFLKKLTAFQKRQRQQRSQHNQRHARQAQQSATANVDTTNDQVQGQTSGIQKRGAKRSTNVTGLTKNMVNDFFKGDQKEARRFASVYNRLAQTELGQGLGMHDLKRDWHYQPDSVRHIVSYYRNIDFGKPRHLISDVHRMHQSIRNNLMNAYLDAKFKNKAYAAGFATSYSEQFNDKNILALDALKRPSSLDRNVDKYFGAIKTYQKRYPKTPTVASAWNKLNQTFFGHDHKLDAATMSDLMRAYNFKYRQKGKEQPFIADALANPEMVAVRSDKWLKDRSANHTKAAQVDQFLDMTFSNPNTQQSFVQSWQQGHDQVDYHQSALKNWQDFVKSARKVNHDFARTTEPAEGTVVDQDQAYQALGADMMAAAHQVQAKAKAEKTPTPAADQAEDQPNEQSSKRPAAGTQSANESNSAKTKTADKQSNQQNTEASAKGKDQAILADGDLIVSYGTAYRQKHPGMVSFKIKQDDLKALGQAMDDLYGKNDRSWMDRSAQLKSGGIMLFMSSQEVGAFARQRQRRRHEAYRQAQDQERKETADMQKQIAAAERKAAGKPSDDRELARSLSTKALAYEVGRRSVSGLMRTTRAGLQTIGDHLRNWYRYHNRGGRGAGHHPQRLGTFARAFTDAKAEKEILDKQDVTFEREA